MRWSQIHVYVHGRGTISDAEAKEWISDNLPGLVKSSASQPGVVVLADGDKRYFRESEIVRLLDARLGDRVSFTMLGDWKARSRLRTALALRRNATNQIDFLPHYDLELLYDPNSVPRNDPAFRGVFTLSEGAAEGAPHTRTSQDDPILDTQHYKLTIHDLYTLTDVSDEGTTLLGPAGDKTSRPADYRANQRMPFVRCAMPLQLRIVKRDPNNNELPMADGEITVLWSIIDPPPTFVAETSGGAQRPADWLRAFYKKTGPAVQGRIAGNKNCPKKFGGVREDDGGVKATSVLCRERADAVIPLADGGDGTARSGVVVGANGRGVSAVLFCPPPIGGDSYRLSISIQRKKGETMRVAHAAGGVAGPLTHSYQTGVITIWRRFPISCIFRLDIDDPIDWAAVAAVYEPAYIEIAKDFFTTAEFAISEFSVTTHIRNTFPDYPGNLTGWQRGVLAPDCLISGYHGLGKAAVQNRISAMVKNVVSGVCKTNALIDDPNAGTHNGLYVIVCAKIVSTADLLGEYVGAGQFFSTKYCDITKTCKHEIGHAFYLRHGITEPIYYLGRNAVTRVDFPLDHDSADATSCLMSYGNDAVDADGTPVAHPVVTHFCAVCLLSLRFWDMVKVRRDLELQRMVQTDLVARTIYLGPPDSPGGSLTVALDGSGGANECGKIVLAHVVAADAVEIHEQIDCRVRESIRFVPLAAPDATISNTGGWMLIDLSHYEGGQWTISSASLGTFDHATSSFTAAAPGTVTLSYSHHGAISNTVTIQIT